MYKIAQQAVEMLDPDLAIEVIDKLLRIHNNNEARYDSLSEDDLEEDNLGALMIWADTEEGWDYWDKIYLGIKGVEL